MELSKEQKLAIKHKNGPALILAVPGSGKTSILLHRILRLIDQGVDPKRILTFTFSKAASTDIKKRFSKLYPHNKNLPKFFTIHALCFSIIRHYSKLRGKEYRLIEGEKVSKYKIIASIYYELNKKPISEQYLEELINKISYYKNSLIDPEKEKVKITNFRQIYRKYEDYKKENNLIDFDDMIILAYEILKKDNYLLNKIRSSFDYLQLDEGQDTSRAQFQFIKLIAAPKNNLFIVADDDQSIYAFRGADPDYLLNLKNIYKNLTYYYLQNNFRSTKNIVNTSSKFIDKNSNRFSKKISTLNDYLEPVNIIKLGSSEDQYKFIYENILKNKNLSQAILYRNNLSSLGVIEYLERKNLDFSINSSKLKILNHFIVKDILSIIEFSNDTSRIDLFSNFYYKIHGYISKKHLNFMKKNLGENILIPLLSYPGLPTYYKENISMLIKDFKNLKGKNIFQQINYILYDMGYDDYLKDSAKKFNYSYENLKEFCHHLIYIASSEKDIDSFLARLKHLEYMSNTKSYNDSLIKLSTIHSSKGLEYDIVYIIDLVDGVIPSNKGDSKDLEEERRLFYVAMTRAKTNLYLIYPKIYNGRYVLPSSFIDELAALSKTK